MVPLRVEQPDLQMLWIAGLWRDEVSRGECFSIITTEPNGVIAPVHDRMPAVISAEQIPAYLAGELHEFGPSAVPLIYSEADNFLKKAPAGDTPPPIQGELL